MLTHRIKKLTGDELKSDALKYRQRMLRLIKKSRPDHIVAERYVPRRQGLANENVNMMLGFILCELATTGIEVDLYLAATWKNRVKKIFDLDSYYALFPRLPDHEIDAAFIGMYVAEKKYGFDLLNFAKITVRRRVGLQMMKCSQVIKPPPRKKVVKKIVAKKAVPKKRAKAKRKT